MNQRRLYRTIESFASKHFKTDRELLKHVVNEIVKNEDIAIKGGRIWLYDPSTESYRLIHQIGMMQRLEPGYVIPVARYPIFLRLAEHRSVLAKETDKVLQKKGILKFFATGVGEKIPFKKGFLYPYVLAFNSDATDEALLPELNIISLAVSSLLRGRNIEQKARLLEKDLDKAREIQQSILPTPYLRFHHFEIYGNSRAEQIVGGDFFDYLLPDGEKDRLSIVVGDAASKGLQAAAQAMYVVGALRMGTLFHTKISILMSRINSIINKTFAEEQFVSMFYCELSDDQKGLVLYSNAGHNSPILYHAHERSIEVLEPTGQILGPFPDAKFRVENTTLKPGDVMLMYSDGISEARDINDRGYGEKRLEEKLEEVHRLSAREICEAVFDDVMKFSIGSGVSDDKTLVVVKRVH
ncbi:MAG TPA: PP2C family protein-serine/threonine phosphatase [Bacteroidota bacterium]|nr:PP2C family protein-serine/threonine phosphatase [Bacteroidota bacterium]